MFTVFEDEKLPLKINLKTIDEDIKMIKEIHFSLALLSKLLNTHTIVLMITLITVLINSVLIISTLKVILI